MSSHLYLHAVTLVTRGAQTGRDRYNQPIYGPPRRIELKAWLEPIDGGENVAAAEQYVRGYWVTLPERAAVAGQLEDVLSLVTGADQIELPGLPGLFEVVGDVGWQQGGLVVEGYVYFKAEKVTG